MPVESNSTKQRSSECLQKRKKKNLGSHVKELVVHCGNEARLNAMVITVGRSARKNTNFPKPVSNLVSWDLNQDLRNEKPAIENHRTYYGSTHIARNTVAG